LATQKPTIPKGTRDFGVTEMVRRNYIFDIIRSTFQRFGFKPIETPAMENLSTLLGKYGEEGDRLIFKMLNSGDFLSAIPGNTIQDKTSIETVKYISEKALRYDLTVPFARFVVMHQNEITFPFKRYQIQPVWRADRPQKGRYREFYQCDVDVIGSNSLLNELELIQIVDTIYQKLNINVVIKINNRKVLTGIAEVIGEAEKIVDITVAIDKLDKIGLDGVNKELATKGIPQAAITKLQPIIEMTGNSEQKLNVLKNILKDSPTGLRGIAEVETIFTYLKSINLSSPVEFDLTLARGLNYYTGAIFEVKAMDASMGSIAGGGRYDDLTGIFGMPNVSGVGISFGLDRIYDVMNELKLFPETAQGTTKLLFVNFGAEEEKYCLPLVAEAREKGINSEIYPDAVKIKKQLDYANANTIPFVAVVGANEMSSGRLKIKDMNRHQETEMDIKEFVNFIISTNASI